MKVYQVDNKSNGPPKSSLARPKVAAMPIAHVGLGCDLLPNKWLYSRTILLYALDHINNVFLWDSAVF
jgi:hypothetical protein